MSEEIKIQSLEITQEKLEKVFKLTDELNEVKEKLSEKLRTSQDRNNHVKHKITIDDKEQEVTEKECWYDYYHNAEEAKTFSILNNLYPEIFMLKKQQDSLADELRQYFVMEFGVDYTAMTLTDYIKIMQALIKLDKKQD